jgi:guanidinopropionase
VQSETTACVQLDCAFAVKRGLDPAYAPGTGTPEIGGYTPHEAQRMLRGLRGLNLVGDDVVEVSPPFDMSGNTALVGVTMM